MSIILATWEAEIGRVAGLDKPRQNVRRLHLNQQLGVVDHTCHPKFHGRLQSEGSSILDGLNEKLQDPISEERG
jgi:hypothetical protein